MRWVFRIVESLLAAIGLAGIPDDLTQWKEWLSALSSDEARWIFVATAVSLFFVTELYWRQGRHREPERVPAADKGTPVLPLPEGHVSIRNAVKYLIDRREPGHVAKDSQYAYELAADMLRDHALDGSVHVWGRKRSAREREPVPRAVWRAAKVDIEDLCQVDGSPGRTWRYIAVAGYQPYVDLSVAFADLDRVLWPEERH